MREGLGRTPSIHSEIRAEGLMPEERSELAGKAVQARWAKAKAKKSSGVAKGPNTQHRGIPQWPSGLISSC